MSLFTASLNSGSNGNCYYIGNEREAILVDAGISCREVEKRMRRIGLKMDMVKALFISHEHGDHIRGVEGLVKKYDLPVYITAPTLHSGRLRISAHLINNFKPYEAIAIGGLSVLPFTKIHDAADPHSFVISGNGVKIGVFTDIGVVCDHVIANFKVCNAIFLEANYDEEMLVNGQYPYHLKKRISGGQGHLSNRQALELFLAHRPPAMTHVYLSHLSKDNNCPELAYELFMEHAGKTHIAVASRYGETSVFHVEGVNNIIKIPAKKTTSVQTSLFS